MSDEAKQFRTMDEAFTYFCEVTTEGDWVPFYDEILEVWFLLNTETNRLLVAK